LKDAGITIMTAHHCETAANIQEKEFEEIIDRAKEDRKPITYASVEKEIKQKKRVSLGR